MRLLHEHDLAGEEVVVVDEFVVVGNDRVGLGLERQDDVQAEAIFDPCSFVARFHDPRPGTGNDHPASGHYGGGELLCPLVSRIARFDSGAPKDRTLWLVLVGSEDLEGVTELLHGVGYQFVVTVAGFVAGSVPGGELIHGVMLAVPLGMT